MNADKTEYMSFTQKGDFATLNGGSLKLVSKFICLGSDVSSTENDINVRLAKAWTAIDRLSIKWKSNISDKIKRRIFSSSGCVDSTTGCNPEDLPEAMNDKETWRERVWDIRASRST